MRKSRSSSKSRRRDAKRMKMKRKITRMSMDSKITSNHARLFRWLSMIKVHHVLSEILE
jgi:hypothetical protein